MDRSMHNERSKGYRLFCLQPFYPLDLKFLNQKQF
jgi:hypothetical protein